MTPHQQPAARQASRAVVRADPDDLDILSLVIAEAFFDLAPSRWLIADPAARREIFPGYFRLYLEHALAHGVVHTTPGRTAAALWIPHGLAPATPPEDYSVRLAAATSPWTSRFTTFDTAVDHRHPAGVAHHHLALLAVRPDRQGHGTGTALLNAHHAALDRDGTPAYLEASDPHTCRLYLTRGYTDNGPPIRLPDGPALYPMWRQPHPRPAPPQTDRNGRIA